MFAGGKNLHELPPATLREENPSPRMARRKSTQGTSTLGRTRFAL